MNMNMDLIIWKSDGVQRIISHRYFSVEGDKILTCYELSAWMNSA